VRANRGRDRVLQGAESAYQGGEQGRLVLPSSYCDIAKLCQFGYIGGDLGRARRSRIMAAGGGSAPSAPAVPSAHSSGVPALRRPAK